MIYINLWLDNLRGAEQNIMLFFLLKVKWEQERKDPFNEDLLAGYFRLQSCSSPYRGIPPASA